MPNKKPTAIRGGRVVDRTPPDSPVREAITREFGDTRGQSGILEQAGEVIGSAISSVFGGIKDGGEHFAFRTQDGGAMEFQYKDGKWYEWREGGLLGGSGWRPVRDTQERQDLNAHLEQRRKERLEQRALLSRERQDLER